MKFIWLMTIFFSLSNSFSESGFNSAATTELIKRGYEAKHTYMGEIELLKTVDDIANELLKRWIREINPSFMQIRNYHYGAFFKFDWENRIKLGSILGIG